MNTVQPRACRVSAMTAPTRRALPVIRASRGSVLTESGAVFMVFLAKTVKGMDAGLFQGIAQGLAVQGVPLRQVLRADSGGNGQRLAEIAALRVVTILETQTAAGVGLAGQQEFGETFRAAQGCR